MSKKIDKEQLSIENESQNEGINEASVESFEEQSPMLSEEVIERKNDLILEAQPPAQEETKAIETIRPLNFGKPQLNTAAPTTDIKDSAKDPESSASSNEDQSDSIDESCVSEDFNSTTEKQETTSADDLPKMKVENMDIPEQGQTMDGIKKKAAQTTAKWSWTLFENAGPKLQLFFAEMDESEIRRYVADDELPPEAVDFAKEYNQSLEEEFEIKDWEKELIYPPFEELLEQAGMNTSMSPGARLGIGLTVVLGARAMQTKKYRMEREELVERLLKSYAKSKGDSGIEDQMNGKTSME